MKIGLRLTLFAALFLHAQQGRAQAQLTNCDEFENEAKAECLKAVNTLKDRLSEFKVNFGKEIADKSCDRGQISRALGGTPAESRLDFLESVCGLAHNFGKIVGNESDESRINPADIDKVTIQKNLDLLRKGMTKGLPRKENGLAQYFEFLFEGLLASKNYDTYLATDARANIEQRLLFCSARQNAQALYEQIDWSTTVFNFATNVSKVDALNTTLPKIVASLIGSQGPLAQDKGATCLEVMANAEADVQKAIETALDAAIKPYFSSTSPISGMIQRRVERLKGPADALESKVDALSEQAAIQAGILRDLKSATAGAIAQADKQVDDYKENFVAVTAISQWFDRFKAGLFMDPNGENTLRVLRETYDRVYDPACGTLSTTFGTIDPDVTCKQNPQTEIQLTKSVGNLADELEEFKRNFEAAVEGEGAYNKATQYICAIYYCNVLANTTIRKQLLDDPTNAYCRKSPTTQLCLVGTTVTPKSKFTLTVDGKPESRGVNEICQKANFKEKWISNKLSSDEALSCMDAMSKNTL